MYVCVSSVKLKVPDEKLIIVRQLMAKCLGTRVSYCTLTRMTGFHHCGDPVIARRSLALYTDKNDKKHNKIQNTIINLQQTYCIHNLLSKHFTFKVNQQFIQFFPGGILST